MTDQELQELGREDDVTREAIEMLMNDQSFFEQVFEGPLSGIREGRTLFMRRKDEPDFQEVEVVNVSPVLLRAIGYEQGCPGWRKK